MDDDGIAALRLRNQGLAGPGFARPADAVAWLGAVQSQEAAVARWSVGQRCEGAVEADVLQALVRGDIVRSHLLRPTWHFVARADLRWMTELTRPKVLALAAYQDRKLGIDEAQFTRSQHLMAEALGNGRHLSRDELSNRLEAGGLAATGPRLSHFLMRAELSLLICSGAPRDHVHTYALVDERIPAQPPRPRDEGLAELAHRFFRSHGPATLKDFMIWASLGAREARLAVDAAGTLLTDVPAAGGRWLTGSSPRCGEARAGRPPTAHWLQGYDEYLVAHSDSRRIAMGTARRDADSTPSPFIHALVVDGRCAGTWRRDGRHAICLSLSRPLNEAEQRALWLQTQRLSDYVGQPVSVRLADGPHNPRRG